MKNRFLSTLIGVGVAPLIFQVLPDAAVAKLTDSYPLVCRGTETFKAAPPSSSCEGCVNAAEVPKFVGFKFIRGSKPSGKGLAPGECSWLDRAMWADEPDILIQEFDPFASVEKYAWIKELSSADSYWTFNVYSTRGRLLAINAERNGKIVLFDKGLPGGSLEVRSPDLYIVEAKIIDLPPPALGSSRLAVRVGNRGTADAGESTLDLKRMKVCRDQLVFRSYRQAAVPALRAGEETLVHFDDFDPEWGAYITREGKDASRLEITVNPSDLYPDCITVSPVKNYEKAEKEKRNNSFVFDPKVR